MNTVEKRIKRMARRVFLAKAWAIALILSYVDLCLDVVVGIEFLLDGNRPAGLMTLGLTGFSLMTQALMAFTLGQGFLATFLALLGAKPLFDTYNVVSKHPLLPGSQAHLEFALSTTKFEEVVVSSLPQGFFQCYFLMQQDPERRKLTQFSLVFGEAVRVAYLVMETDRGIDLSDRLRALFPQIHGYMPPSPTRQNLVSFGTFVFVGFYLSCKWIALTVLTLRSPVATSVWMAAECFALLLGRLATEGSLRFYHVGTEGLVPSAVVHFMLFVGGLGAPFPVLRFPGYLGLLYPIVVLYSLLLSNPAMIYYGTQGDLKEDDHFTAWGKEMLWVTLAFFTTMCFGAAALAAAFMDREHWRSFAPSVRLGHPGSMRRYLDEWAWTRRGRTELVAATKGSFVVRPGAGKERRNTLLASPSVRAEMGLLGTEDDTDANNASRAEVLKDFAIWTWPHKKVEMWLDDYWDEWVMDVDNRPPWCSDKFLRLLATRVPPKLLPPGAIRMRDEIKASVKMSVMLGMLGSSGALMLASKGSFSRKAPMGLINGSFYKKRVGPDTQESTDLGAVLDSMVEEGEHAEETAANTAVNVANSGVLAAPAGWVPTPADALPSANGEAGLDEVSVLSQESELVELTFSTREEMVMSAEYTSALKHIIAAVSTNSNGWEVMGWTEMAANGRACAPARIVAPRARISLTRPFLKPRAFRIVRRTRRTWHPLLQVRGQAAVSRTLLLSEASTRGTRGLLEAASSFFSRPTAASRAPLRATIRAVRRKTAAWAPRKSSSSPR